ALAASDELAAIAGRYGSDALEAAAHAARSRLAFAEEDAGAAVREARQALRLWQGIEAPYEAAEARMLLASGYLAQGNAGSAVLELEAATAAFDRLGAAGAARAAGELLAPLGGYAPSEADAARVARTFMFTDIVRSTSLVDAIGDEAWSRLVIWHDNKLRSLFAAHQGQEVDHAGDGFFVAFPDATAAVECAVAIQRTLAAHRQEHGFAPQVRTGLHSAEASYRGAGYRGKGVHEAARIAAMAEGDEILASSETFDLSKSRFFASQPRSVSLKGVSRPFQIVSIDWR
ncbi:MAG: adenylate/guanylate cyclase domain-containing protein, partial [Gaiellales bacterium]